MKTGIELIAEERKRQIEEEGWTAEHDDQHGYDDIALASAWYALPEWARKNLIAAEEDFWPWDQEWDKTIKHGRERQLVIAGALILAEIDRLQRNKDEGKPGI
jgi:hypothetical protein